MLSCAPYLQILADKSRLIKRTQLKRTTYRVLGKPQEDATTNTKETMVNELLHTALNRSGYTACVDPLQARNKRI